MQQYSAIAGQMPAVGAAPPKARRRRTWYVVLILCFFAAVIPETLTTTSTSVAKIVAQPYSLVFLMLFYGLADLLIREALIRQRLGWVSLTMLGVAFSFFNEGVIAGTWYPAKGDSVTYIGQVSVATASGLTVFHLFISVIVPVTFIETMFPSLAGTQLLRRRRGVVISAILFLLVTSLFIFSPTYRPYRLIIFMVALALAIVAVRLPAARPRILTDAPPPRLWRLRWAGFFGSLIMYIVILIVPAVTEKLAGPLILVGQAIPVALDILFIAPLLRIGRRWTASAGWSLRHSLALITGAVAFPMLFTLLPPFWPTLELFATVPFFVLLIVLNRRLYTREKRAQAALASQMPAPVYDGEAVHSAGKSDGRGESDDRTAAASGQTLYGRPPISGTACSGKG